jgi:hypothetical protein
MDDAIDHPNVIKTTLFLSPVHIAVRLVLFYFVSFHVKQQSHQQSFHNIDKKIFINKKDAYYELKNLIEIINRKLWKGDIEKEQNLYYMRLLFYGKIK